LHLNNQPLPRIQSQMWPVLNVRRRQRSSERFGHL